MDYILRSDRFKAFKSTSVNSKGNPSDIQNGLVNSLMRNEPKEPNMSTYQVVDRASVQDMNLGVRDPLSSSSVFSVPVRNKGEPGLRRVNNHWQEPQRDRSGFLIPNQPKPLRPVADIISPEEAWKVLRLQILELTQILSPIEIEYRLLKINQNLEHEISKQRTSSRLGFRTPSEFGRSFRDSSQRSLLGDTSRHYPGRNFFKLPAIYEKHSDISRQFNCNESLISHNFNRPTYTLRNWTILRGRGGSDLLLHGTLYDMSWSLLEDNYTSSKIIVRLGDSCVRTTLADFFLQGEFQDEGNSIPKEIRVHFKKKKFPENWKRLISLWNSVEQEYDRKGVNTKRDEGRNNYANKRKYSGPGKADEMESTS